MDSRYIKNITELFPEECQNELLTKTISIIGCGGQGGYIADFIARLGVQKILLWDGDCYERSNLNRQIGCLEKNIGENKALAIKEMISAINSIIKVEAIPEYFGINAQNDFEQLIKSDLVFLCFDTSQDIFSARQIIRYAIEQGVVAIECPCNFLGGFISVTTKRDLSHFDNYTQQLCEQKMVINDGGVPAYHCALVAAEAVNAMMQYFYNYRFAPIDSRLDIDIFHHKYIQSDQFGII